MQNVHPAYPHPAPQPLAKREVTGDAVQPQHFEVVDTMHTRKTRMAKLANQGFIVLPGGCVCMGVLACGPSSSCPGCVCA